jgi:hypothetical protein
MPNLFEPFSVTPEQQKIMRLAQMDAEQLLSRAEHLPESRHKALFATTLENAMMWFNKAVSRSEPEFEPEFVLSEEDNG